MKSVGRKIMLAALVLYFPISLGFISVGRSGVVVEKINSCIEDSAEARFVSSSEIKNMVKKKFGKDILGVNAKELNCKEIEDYVMRIQAIKECKVYYTLEGTLNIDITQRRPIMRIYNGNDSYYYDEFGNKMPAFRSYSSHVVVANGSFDKIKHRTDLYDLATFIYNDDFWRANIQQIFINSKGDFVLVPRVGDHLINLGNDNYFHSNLEDHKADSIARREHWEEEMETRFKNLKTFYEDGLEIEEWSRYSEISLKYNGQIVCKKRN